MGAYCDRQSVDLNSIAFLFDGRRLRAEQTPDEVCLPSVSVCFRSMLYLCL
ncbi:Small ubiquitin-related modifier 1 [Linum perenne]